MDNTTELITKLITLSRHYGVNPEFVLAGGGNTSLKDKNVLYVKASGHTLASIDRKGFVAMSQQKLQDIWAKHYPGNQDQREDAVLLDMMEARIDGEAARPSVEVLLHNLLPQKYVVHLHPALVNGLTCAIKGEENAKQLFGERVLWIPLVNPGYVLAKVVKDKLMEFQGEHGAVPESILLQNHGIFIGAETPESIKVKYRSIMRTLQEHLKRKPDFGSLLVSEDRRKIVEKSLSLAADTASCEIYSCNNQELALRLRDRHKFLPVSSAFTPDHIVYSGFKPLWVPESVFSGDTEAEIRILFDDYRKQNGIEPKTIAVQNTGIFTFSENALVLFLDTVQVAAYTESFGGHLFMADDQINFIRTWEVEKYRAKVSG